MIALRSIVSLHHLARGRAATAAVLWALMLLEGELRADPRHPAHVEALGAHELSESVGWHWVLTPPPPLHATSTAPAPHLDIGPRAADDQPRSIATLDVTLHYLKLAVTGSFGSVPIPFIGTSTTVLGGLRIRF